MHHMIMFLWIGLYDPLTGEPQRAQKCDSKPLADSYLRNSCSPEFQLSCDGPTLKAAFDEEPLTLRHSEQWHW